MPVISKLMHFSTFKYCIAAIFGSVLIAGAEIVPAQINAVLGGPADLNWSVAGPDASAWSISGDNLNLFASGSGKTFTLQTTVAGPGVLSLRSFFNSSLFDASILVDGLQSGPNLPSYDAANRVSIPAGSHVVQWRMITNSRTYSGGIGFHSATWEPYSVVPLQTAAGNADVALSGDWLGQDRWHAGDGSAAWSGLNLYDPVVKAPSNPVLRGNFTGPGILTYRMKSSRGLKDHIDGGIWSSIYAQTPEWTFFRRGVGEGAHLAEWTTGEVNSSVRDTTEAWIDEIRLVPDLDLSIALGTPSLVWQAPVVNGQRAFGWSDASANGGSLAVIPSRNTIVATMTDERFLKFRFRGGYPLLSIYGNSITTDLSKVTSEEGTDWKNTILAMTGIGAISVGTYSADLEIDSITPIEPVGTITAAIGMPEGSLTFGGTPWKFAPIPETDRYGAKAYLKPESNEAWMDFAVTGPAEVQVDFQQSSGTLIANVDGKTVWDTQINGSYSRTFAVEVPAGVHSMRLLAQISPNPIATQERFRAVAIDKISVRPLPAGGKILAALDDSAPWARTDDWNQNTDISHRGEGALSPAIEGPGYSSVLRRSYTGPGVVNFWTYLGVRSASDSAINLDWKTDVYDRGLRYSSSGDSGWQPTSLWVPPGEHWIEFDERARGEGLRQIAIDDFSFTPSPILPLAEAIGGAAFVWRNDPVNPWIGIAREGVTPRVAVSPIMGMGLRSEIATTIQGPGTLSFHWRKAGAKYVHGELWIDGRKRASQSPADEDITVVLGDETQMEVKWVSISESDYLSWIEVENFAFAPDPEVPLAATLDAPDRITWTTSPDHPFKGRNNPNAVNGTAAHIGLAAGESGWLEATVEGQGLFDFNFLDVPNTDHPYNARFEFYFDGVKAAIDSYQWPAQWILGEGTHHLRLKITNGSETGDSLTIAADQVSWSPLTAIDPQAEWSSSSPDALVSFTTDDGSSVPQVALNMSLPGTHWIERTVTGPGLLEWSARNSAAYPTISEIAIDGISKLVVNGDSIWKEYHLSIPAGTHTVRWTATEGPPLDPEYFDEDAGHHFDALWQFSNFDFTPGVTPLMTAMDNDQSAWLVIGQNGAGILFGNDAYDGEDFWPVGGGSLIYFCNLSDKGLRASGAFANYQYHSEEYQNVWALENFWIAPREMHLWTASENSYESITSNAIDAFSAQPIDVVTLAEAMDVAEDISANGWVGIAIPQEAFDGIDSAWSQLRFPNDQHVASLAIEGPARVKFRWKNTGAGNLGLKLNGAWLPVPAPTSEWQEVEFEIRSRSLVEWVHLGTPATSRTTSGDAWVDAISISAAPARTISEVIASASGLSFTATDANVNSQWQAIGYRAQNGDWREGGRGVTGASILKATVSGPAIINFNGMCAGPDFPSAKMSATKVIGRSSEWIIVNPEPQIIGHFLSVTVDDIEKVRFQNNGNGEFSSSSIFVPAGAHEVKWQIDTLQNGWVGQNVVPATTAGVQGWVANVSVQTPQAHYEKWAREQNFSAGEGAAMEDADGDGFSNFMEYAYGSDPKLASSVPLSVYSGRSPSGFYSNASETPAAEYELHVPFLQPHVSGILECSANLRDWNESEPLRTLPKTTFWFDTHYDSATHQSILYSIAPDHPNQFFRVKLNVPTDE